MIKINLASFGKLVFTLLICHTTWLSAQDTIPDSQIHERIQCIQNMLDHSNPGINRWWNGWLAGYSVATAVQGIAFFVSDDTGIKQDMALGVATAMIGTVGQILTPLKISHDTYVLNLMPDNTTEEGLNKLRSAEDLLKKTALKEKAWRSWKVHALNETANLGSGLIVWLGYKRSVWDGLENFALNSVVTETQIWTQPIRAMKDYQNYCKKYYSVSISRTNKLQPEYYLKTGVGGVAFTILFR
jgi:hypothetical protein